MTPGKFDIARILKYAPAELIGREAETKILHDAWTGQFVVPPLAVLRPPTG